LTVIRYNIFAKYIGIYQQKEFFMVDDFKDTVSNQKEKKIDPRPVIERETGEEIMTKHRARLAQLQQEKDVAKDGGRY
jgi:hypothetical protein